jgi:hypothetical protein
MSKYSSVYQPSNIHSLLVTLLCRVTNYNVHEIISTQICSLALFMLISFISNPFHHLHQHLNIFPPLLMLVINFFLCTNHKNGVYVSSVIHSFIRIRFPIVLRALFFLLFFFLSFSFFSIIPKPTCPHYIIN